MIITLALVQPVRAAAAPARYESLRGKTLKKPVVVRGRGFTVIRNNTFINRGSIIRHGRNHAAMVEILPPGRGGRIFIRNNRFINRGNIIQHNGSGAAAMTVIRRRRHGRDTTIFSSGNRYLNHGRIINKD